MTRMDPMMTDHVLARAICAFRADPGDPEDGAVDDLLALFLRSPIHCPTGSDQQPLSARLGARGDWLCVFTEQRLLDDYRDATGARWPASAVYTGQDLAQLASALPEPTGILINPSPRRGTGTEASLSLPPEIISRVTKRNGRQYGVFVRLAGETTIQRMTPAGRITDGELFA